MISAVLKSYRQITGEKKSYYAAAALALVMIIFPFSASADIKGIEADLQKQKRELKTLKTLMFEEKQALNKVVKTKSNVLKKIDQIADNLDLINKYVKKLNATSNTLERSYRQKSEELDELRKRIAERNKVIEKRVRKTFIAGKNDFLFFNIIPQEDMDFFKRLFYMKRLVEYDKSIISAAENDEMKKQDISKSLQSRIKEIKSFKKQKSAEISRYTKDQKDLGIKMTLLQNDEDTKRRALREIKKNEKAMEKIIKTLERKRKEELARRKKPRIFDKTGRFCQPVQGRLVTRYGKQYHSTLKTMTKNLGVEYLGSSGESVLSASKGEVVYVDDIPGYGKGIIVHNGSGYYNIYGNLNSIKVKEGDKIKGCQEIAVIPSSGSKSRKKIYFEVKKDRESLNPVEWLKTMIN